MNARSTNLEVEVVARPTPPQRSFLRSEADVRLFVGGLGAGKTFVCALDMLRWGPERWPALCVAPSYRMLVDSVVATVEFVTGGHVKFHRADMYLEMPHGGRLYLRSATKPDLWRSMNMRYGWLEEGCYCRRAGVEQFLARLRGRGWICSTTPLKRSPLYEMVVAPAKEGRWPTTYSEVNAPTESNHHNGAGYGAVMRAALGARLAAQDVDGEWVDLAGGLLTWEEIAAATGRGPAAVRRVVIGVDPAATTGTTGIVVVALDDSGVAWLLDDLSGRMTAGQWSSVVVETWREWRARGVPVQVVAEVNHGGSMVEHTLRSTDASVQTVCVRASDGKRTRAEPVAQLVRGKQVRFVEDATPGLAAQWAGWDPESKESPDRLDASVWAVTHLGLRGQANEKAVSGWRPPKPRRRGV